MATQTEQHKNQIYYTKQIERAIKIQNINCASFNLAFSFSGSDNR